MHTRASLARDLRDLGLCEGDVVMAHASVRSVGEIAGGADQIHLAIRDAIGEGGTLFMYAGCPKYVDEVGRGGLDAATEAEVLEKLPAFDARTARSDRSNGALVELLRTWPGTQVNEHPARFVAIGARATELLSHTPWDFAYGAGSVFERFVRFEGRVLLLGSDHDNVTFLHHAEHILEADGKRIATFQVPILENGVRVWREMREVDSSGGGHPAFPVDAFSRIVKSFLAATKNRGGMVGDARAYLLPASPLLDHALGTLAGYVAEWKHEGRLSCGQPAVDDSALSRTSCGPRGESR